MTLSDRPAEDRYLRHAKRYGKLGMVAERESGPTAAWNQYRVAGDQASRCGEMRGRHSGLVPGKQRLIWHGDDARTKDGTGEILE